MSSEKLSLRACPGALRRGRGMPRTLTRVPRRRSAEPALRAGLWRNPADFARVGLGEHESPRALIRRLGNIARMQCGDGGSILSIHPRASGDPGSGPPLSRGRTEVTLALPAHRLQ